MSKPENQKLQNKYLGSVTQFFASSVKATAIRNASSRPKTTFRVKTMRRSLLPLLSSVRNQREETMSGTNAYRV